MSAILGVFSSARTISDAEARRMLGAMDSRGAERTEIWRDDHCVLAVSRYEWELASQFSGPVLIASDDRYVVAADASVYYRRELVEALARDGIGGRQDSAAYLILAAWRAWGEECANRLDGDFAFIVWDRRERQAVCVRDFGGKRPLHYATPGGELVVASTIGGVLAHPRCPAEINLRCIAGTISGMHFSAGPETAYEAIRVLPHAHMLAWTPSRISVAVPYWEVPVGQQESPLPFEDAADHLRELLRVASRERMDSNGINSVWMSGGWDSTAVFGAAQLAAGTEGFQHRALPVSISYPEGDPGREDEWIQSVADQWNTPVEWIDIADIPFLENEEHRAAERDEPYAHLYANWNMALARGSRAVGSRIALDGNGGDQLFQNSDVLLADLFRRGHWLTLAREWPARQRGGAREFFSSVIKPNMGPRARAAASRLRGGQPLRDYMERPLPEWLSASAANAYSLVQHDRRFLARALPVSLGEREIDWQFRSLFISRAFGLLTGFALSQGVELRSPLSDRRVIEFALSRPWQERSSGAETKLLLRRSMKGLLPDEVLAPRTCRTGITSGYSHTGMCNHFPALLARTMEQPLLLEEYGIIDGRRLTAACERYPRTGNAFTRVNMYYTLQAELWLRAHVAGAEPHGLHAPAAVATQQLV
ncbi:MAG TPA: asparagine synthase-related protein [Gemmatimonadales bacterium]|nr:asparagine synthase-related protein [Gemmatimonadales bacterium]